ncbi:MAG TPA: histidine kinase dimerization/phospho-acceptor domain-containing protein, partial [Ktedonobacteraceae bacterium]|nr:histidine kinase dimerization/phospho-acceptor domain-containing protein [Ktedonobacteraceae bacterium]
MMMEVAQHTGQLNAAEVLAALLDELGAVTDYRTLRDTLPRRLARLLQCRCIIVYQRYGDTLQFVSGSFDDQPGWSSALLSVTHINPVSVHGDTLEARAWQQRKAVVEPASLATRVATPLLYRMRGIGVLVAIRGEQPPTGTQSRHDPSAAIVHYPDYWTQNDAQIVEAITGVVAMLLENARMLERDRDRIQELSLLNSISRQFHASLHNRERVRNHIIQRTREISSADLCDCLLPGSGQEYSEWLSPALQELLLRRMAEQHDAPLIIERPGDAHTSPLVEHLDPSIKTFFAIPLWSGRSSESVAGSPTTSRLLGMIAGGYRRPWKLRREEIILLNVLANQASSVIENITLMAEVIEARNEARKLLRKVLEDQRQQELILESIPSGLLTIDLHERITTCNRAAAAMLDCHAFEAIGQPAKKLLALRTFQQVIQSELPQSETLTISPAQGQERIVQVTLLPFRSDQGELMGALATLTDMTTTHRLEEEKRRLDRLALLGEMAANVAHEVRNPLASIKTSLQMLLDDLDHQPPLPSNNATDLDDEETDGMSDTVKVALKEVERLHAIVHDLLQFSRPSQLHRVRCSLAEISDRLLHMLEKQAMEAGIFIHRLYRDSPPI